MIKRVALVPQHRGFIYMVEIGELSIIIANFEIYKNYRILFSHINIDYRKNNKRKKIKKINNSKQNINISTIIHNTALNFYRLCIYF